MDVYKDIYDLELVGKKGLYVRVPRVSHRHPFLSTITASIAKIQPVITAM